MNAKYQVFVSSTFVDLKEERDQIIKAILEMGHIPVGMEMFNAGDEEQWATIKRTIDQCDYYAVIVAQRYGSLDPETGLGYTEKEYDYARLIGVPVMGFVLDSSAAWPANKRDDDADAALRAEKQVKLAEFVSKKVKGRMVNHWKNQDDLQARFMASFGKIIVSNPRPGWIPATQAVSPEMATELARLSSENAELRDKLGQIGTSSLMPEFELDFWIEWTFLIATERVMPNTSDKTVEQHFGYKLHVELKNSGNLVAERVVASIDIPVEIMSDEYKYPNLKNFPLKILVGESKPSLLSGQTTTANARLKTDAVESKEILSSELSYSIHPDQGYAKYGSLFFSEIEVRSPRPDGAQEVETIIRPGRRAKLVDDQ